MKVATGLVFALIVALGASAMTRPNGTSRAGPVKQKYPNITSVGAECGISKVPTNSTLDTVKIVGGFNAMKNEFPWTASLRHLDMIDEYNELGFGHVCGGSVISQTLILTAAHCVYDDDKAKFKVRVGEYDQADNNDDAQDIDVKNVYTHELYSTGDVGLDYDIAILELTEPITYSDSVQPVCLSTSDPYVGDYVVVVGWGNTETNDSTWTILQQVWVPVLDSATCYVGLPSDQICAGETGYDSCQGDSGGPLAVEWYDPEDYTFYYEQAGVVSWGIGCADAGNPGVYASVSYFRDWIDNIMQLTLIE